MIHPLKMIVILGLALVMTASAQEEPAKKKKMAPLNAASGPVPGKIYIVTPAKNRFTVRLDQPIVTPEKTNKVVAFFLATGGKITIDGSEGTLEGLQKGMRVTVMPQASNPSLAEKVDATKAAPEDKKSVETEE